MNDRCNPRFQPHPFAVRRIIVPTSLRQRDPVRYNEIREAADCAGVAVMTIEVPADIAMAEGDAWLQPQGSGTPILVPDELQGKAVFFISVQGLLCWLYPRLLAQAATALDVARAQMRCTPLAPGQKVTGVWGVDRIEGELQELVGEKVAVMAAWDGPDLEPGWLWFDRASGLCLSRPLLHIDPASLVSLTTAAPKPACSR